MRKLFITLACLVSAFLFSSCGVGNYTVVSGVDDHANVSFVANDSYDIQVTIDGQSYDTKTVKDKEYKSRRNLKKTVKYALPLETGRHTIKVTRNGESVYSKEIIVSTGENKIIQL